MGCGAFLLCVFVAAWWLCVLAPCWWWCWLPAACCCVCLLYSWGAGCCCCIRGCWKGWLVFLAAGREVKGKGGKERQHKTSIPTQNIIYTTFKGWLYNIANPLQKEKGKLTKYGCFPFIPYAFKISTSTPILIIKSSTSLSLLVDLMNSNFTFDLVTYCNKSPRIR